jgi:hypothetical protein
LKTAFLTEPQFVHEFSTTPGLIPVSIAVAQGPAKANEPASHRLIWLDLDRYHCYEGFFDQSLASYYSLLPASPARFTTSLEVLNSVPLEDCVPPSGFIFHPGRCGSTLLAKVLARSRENIVFSEADTHNLVWKVLPGNVGSAIDFYRRLVLSMARRRLASYRAHFIKFTSYNVMQFALIRAAFPETPAVFLYRHPDDVLQSSEREVQPWLGMDIGFDRIWNDAGSALADFCRAALEIRDARFRCLNYSDLSPRNLAHILRFFQIEPSQPAELALMQSEFRWDAKSGRIPRLFVPRDAPVIRADSGQLSLYRALRERSNSEWDFAPV